MNNNKPKNIIIQFFLLKIPKNYTHATSKNHLYWAFRLQQKRTLERKYFSGKIALFMMK